MGKKLSIGVSSVAHKGKKISIGVDNVAHKVKKAWIGDANGKARLFWSGVGLGDAIVLYRGSNSSGYFPYTCCTDDMKKSSYGSFTKTTVLEKWTNNDAVVYALDRHFIRTSPDSGAHDSAGKCYYTTDGAIWTHATNLGTIHFANYTGGLLMFGNAEQISSDGGGDDYSSWSEYVDRYFLVNINDSLGVETKNLIELGSGGSGSPYGGTEWAYTPMGIACINGTCYIPVSHTEVSWSNSGESYSVETYMYHTDNLGTMATVREKSPSVTDLLAICEWYGQILLLHSNSVYLYEVSTRTFNLMLTLRYSHAKVIKFSSDHFLFITSMGIGEVVKVVNGTFTITNTVTINSSYKSYYEDFVQREGVLYYVTRRIDSTNKKVYIDVAYSSDYGVTWTKNQGVTNFSYTSSAPTSHLLSVSTGETLI